MTSLIPASLGVTGRLLIFGWLLSLAPWSRAQAPEAEPPPLRWAADAEGGAPYIFINPRNPAQNIGFEVDLAAALAKELKRPIHFVQYDFKNLIPGLDRGDFDFAMNGLEITPDRLEKVRFSRPYYAFKLQLTVREKEDRFDSLMGCKKVGGVVGTLEDTAAERLLKQLNVRYKIYDGQVEPYLDLVQGRLDAVLLDLPIALYYGQQSMVVPEPMPVKHVGDIVGRGYYAIAFKKNNDALARQIDAALDRLFEQGVVRRLAQKWHLWNDHQEEFIPSGTFLEDLPDEGGDLPFEEKGYLLLLLDGAWVTIFLTVMSFALAVFIALPVALCRLYGPWPLRALATLYVEFFRGIPVLLLLVFLYFGLPGIAEYYQLNIDLRLNAITAAVLGFGLNYAAYEAEIYRAGINAIPVGQWEAAASLGMSPGMTFRRIIFPQAFKLILPPMTNDFVALFKDTSIVSIIAVVELSKQYQILAKSTGNYLEFGAITALLYLIMSVPLGYLSRHLEKRWSKA